VHATLHAVQPFELHGVPYVRLLYVADGEAQPREARLSHDMAYPDPQPGDRIDVHAILGIVDRVSRLAAAD
jgi:hypothetical protein